MLIGKMIKKSG